MSPAEAKRIIFVSPLQYAFKFVLGNYRLAMQLQLLKSINLQHACSCICVYFSSQPISCHYILAKRLRFKKEFYCSKASRNFCKIAFSLSCKVEQTYFM